MMHATSWEKPLLPQTDSLILTKQRKGSRSAGNLVLVPRVQSMKAYILKHHRRLILNTLNLQLSKGSLRTTAPGDWENHPLTTANCTFDQIQFWRTHQSRNILLVETLVSVIPKEDALSHLLSFYCELWVDMRSGMRFFPGQCGLAKDRPEPYGWLLSEYLVPIFHREEIEQEAENLLLRYCPEALENPDEHDAFLLARRMGLRVEQHPLYHRTSTLSILFFCAGDIWVEDEAEEAGETVTAKEALPKRISIPPKTIVINTKEVHKDDCQMEVYHECIHFDWHFMFYRLQAMHTNDIRQLQSRHVVVPERKEPVNPVRWMEWQARRGAYALMMPLRLMRPLVAHYGQQVFYARSHQGQWMDRIARSIARDYGFPKFRVRARMIQMGYTAAKGALNYVDGRYIEPFAFALDSGRGDNSFVIDRESAFDLYRTDEVFCQYIREGKLIYADGHVVLNDPQYVRQTSAGLRLTPWANAHVDQCCLRFISVYEQSGLADYQFGQMNSDEEYNRHYMTFAQGNRAGSQIDQLRSMKKVLDELPNSFPDTLVFLMKRAHVTIEQLEERSFLSGRTISRLRTEERGAYSLDQVIAICVALHLPPWLSSEVLKKARLMLMSTVQHKAYQFVLDCLFMDSVEDVQRFLKEAGMERLKLRQEEE